MPCNVNRELYIKSQHGDDWLVDDDGNFFKCFTEEIKKDESDGAAYSPHWVNCPEAQRRQKEKAAAKDRTAAVRTKQADLQAQLSLF